MKTLYKGQIDLTTETGETIACDVINKSGDILDRKGWRRVIMADLMASIEEIGNKKLKVLEYLIDNMNGSNEINTTYDEIETNTGISRATIATTMKALQKSNLIKRVKGIYVLNCGVIGAYGSNEKNKYLMIEYGFNEKSIIKPKENIKELRSTLKNQSNELNIMKTLNTNLMDEIENLKNIINNQYKAS